VNATVADFDCWTQARKPVGAGVREE
jgi:hypothetical protein